MDKDVIIVELAPALQVQALASKQIDALLALEPMSTVAKKKGAGKVIVEAPVEKVIANPFYGGAGVITTKFVHDYPKTAEKVSESSKKLCKRSMKIQVHINNTWKDTHPYRKRLFRTFLL